MYKSTAELFPDGWKLTEDIGLELLEYPDAKSLAEEAAGWWHMEIHQQKDGEYIVVLPKATEQDILNAHPYPTLEAAMLAGLIMEES